MHISAFPALRLRDLAAPARREAELPFPLGAPRTSAFYAARYALYRLLRALGIGRGDEVLLPAYHHGNEVRAVRATGASVRFFEVGAGCAPRREELALVARPPVRALLAIHTLGLPQPIEELAALCRERGIVLIEDCAHAFLGRHAGRPLGSFGDYAIFCIYKTVPVPNGGLLVQNRADGPALDVAPRTAPDLVSEAAALAELTLHGVRMRHEALGQTLLQLKRASGRALSAARVSRLPVGDAGFDPAASDTAMSSFCQGLLRRFDYAAIRARRRANFQQLHERLWGRVALPRLELPEGACPLFFPLLVSDKAAAAQLLAVRGVSSVEFWNTGDPGARGFANTDFLRAHLLELPIHQDLGPEHVDVVADAVLELGPVLELEDRCSRAERAATARMVRRAVAAALDEPDDRTLRGSA
jgi:dTDP-4-amino-4,6-dideoxygalactose transaminase